MKRRRFPKVLMFILFASVAVVTATFVVMSLWNALIPAIFAVKAITFWQALGLLLLSKIFFGGPRPFSGGPRRWRRRMTERWEQMSPEEREKFKQGLRGCRNLSESEAVS